MLFFGWIGYIRNWIKVTIFKDSESLQRNEPWTNWMFGTVWYMFGTVYYMILCHHAQNKYLWYTLVNYCKTVWELYPKKQLRQMANYAFSSIFRFPIPHFLWVSFHDCRLNKTQPLRQFHTSSSFGNRASLRLQTPHFEFSKVLPFFLNQNHHWTKTEPTQNQNPFRNPSPFFQTFHTNKTFHPSFRIKNHHRVSSRKVIFQHDNFPAVTSVGKPSTNERSILIGPGVTTKSNLGGWEIQW